LCTKQFFSQSRSDNGIGQGIYGVAGIVGGLYLRAQRLDQDLPENTRFAIADAIYDQYKPESMEDRVPRTMEGAVLSLADKADSVAGMFALGLQPTGSKDPFALRRQANAIVRTIAAHKFGLPLELLTRLSLEAYCGTEAEKKFAPTAKRNGAEPRKAQGSMNEFFASGWSSISKKRTAWLTTL